MPSTGNRHRGDGSSPVGKSMIARPATTIPNGTCHSDIHASQSPAGNAGSWRPY